MLTPMDMREPPRASLAERVVEFCLHESLHRAIERGCKIIVIVAFAWIGGNVLWTLL